MKKVNAVVLFAQLLLICMIVPVQTQLCQMGPDPSVVRARDRELTIIPQPAAQYLLYETTACSSGAISEWQFRHSGHLFETVHFQVWRPDPSPSILEKNYKLVGENVIDVKSINMFPLVPSTVTYRVPEGDRIPVETNDVIGWLEESGGSNRRQIGYTDGGPGRVLARTVTQCTTAYGVTCDWGDPRWGGTEAQYVDREYGLQAEVTQVRPVLVRLPATIQLDVSLAVGTVVFHTHAVNLFEDSPVIVPSLVYSIAGGSCTGYTIDSTTGVVSISQPAYNRGCTLSVDVQYENHALTRNGVLTINALPTNNNGPFTFSNLPNSITINAQTSPNVVYTVQLDINPTPDASFAIAKTEPINAPFQINSLLNPDRGEVSLTVTAAQLAVWTGPLVYTLFIVASNRYYTTGVWELEVSITNAQPPTAPYITNLDAVVTIPETTGNINGIYTVAAGGGNPGYTFTIQKMYPLNVNAAGVFAITAGGGRVDYVGGVGTLDYFADKEYILEIQVVDSTPMTGDRKNLTVLVTWENMEPKWGATTYIATLHEHFKGETGICLMSSDRDIPLGDWTHYIITTTTPLTTAFTTDNITHTLHVVTPLTLPPAPLTYTLTLRLMDSFGVWDTAGDATVTITVTDANNFSPLFNPATYEGIISEDDTNGSPVGVMVVAIDTDLGAPWSTNGIVMEYYILEEEAKEYFMVDNSGVVTVKQPVPWVTYPYFTLHVGARDGGSPPRHSDPPAVINITITPLNMHAPVFNPDYLLIELDANIDPGSLVSTMNATDPDPSSVSQLSYYMLTVQQDFGVDAVTGQVTTIRRLDARRTYLLYVNARDNGSSPQEYFSDPCTLQVVTYDGHTSLVDIHLYSPLEHFTNTQDDFLDELSDVISPWIPRIINAELRKDKTVVTVYALEKVGSLTTRSDSIRGVPHGAVSKASVSPAPAQLHTVHRDRLLSVLREDIDGTPSSTLLSSQFSPWQPYKVHPAHRVWVLDTRGGRATLGIVCAIVFITIVLLTFCYLKHTRRLCFRNKGNKQRSRPRSPRVEPHVKPASEYSSQVPPVTTAQPDLFSLGYPGGAPPDKKIAAIPLIPPRPAPLADVTSVPNRPPPKATAGEYSSGHLQQITNPTITEHTPQDNRPLPRQAGIDWS